MKYEIIFLAIILAGAVFFGAMGMRYRLETVNVQVGSRSIDVLVQCNRFSGNCEKVYPSSEVTNQ
jgi:hypothetical protein